MKINFNSCNLAKQNIIHIYYSVFSNDKQALQYMFRAAWAAYCMNRQWQFIVGASQDDEG